ncbi:hypothetical protein ISU10_01650 [Nocardioides agariphilus]|uniref:Uncharacterized protein n=1 Tax=Nocardioides agariphilus TaxID=433664 RepID=A0A930YGZ9_9ACTN|nr:hypothetical protein [Nocardioides agariphilus]MBF4766468.1 hypothetical protein [Nocardioides agariphilus]
MSNSGTNIYIAMQLAKYRQQDLVREAQSSRLARRARRGSRRSAPDS